MENKIEEFKKYLMNLERSASTIESYVLAVRFFFERYEELSKENMIDFKQWLMGEYKPKTAALRCVAMNVFCDYAGRPDCKVKGIKMQKNASVENVITMREYKSLLEHPCGGRQVEGLLHSEIPGGNGVQGIGARETGKKLPFKWGVYALDEGQKPYDYDSEAFDRREQGVF